MTSMRVEMYRNINIILTVTAGNRHALIWFGRGNIATWFQLFAQVILYLQRRGHKCT